MGDFIYDLNKMSDNLRKESEAKKAQQKAAEKAQTDPQKEAERHKEAKEKGWL